MVAGGARLTAQPRDQLILAGTKGLARYLHTGADPATCAVPATWTPVPATSKGQPVVKIT